MDHSKYRFFTYFLITLGLGLTSGLAQQDEKGKPPVEGINLVKVPEGTIALITFKDGQVEQHPVNSDWTISKTGFILSKNVSLCHPEGGYREQKLDVSQTEQREGKKEATVLQFVMGSMICPYNYKASKVKRVDLKLPNGTLIPVILTYGEG